MVLSKGHKEHFLCNIHYILYLALGACLNHVNNVWCCISYKAGYTEGKGDCMIQSASQNTVFLILYIVFSRFSICTSAQKTHFCTGVIDQHINYLPARMLDINLLCTDKRVLLMMPCFEEQLSVQNQLSI